MRILHTSDWHIGRSFHGHSTLPHLSRVLEGMTGLVVSHGVDVVVVAGDIFDTATPAAENFDVLTHALTALRDAGVVVVLTSGNHDSATRLGFQSGFASLAGIHVLARPENFGLPVTISDQAGPVHFYGIPYLEPAMVRHRYPDETLRTHADVLGFAMDGIRADLSERGGRSVVISHCFAVDVAAPGTEQGDVERDITSGGLDIVPLSVFDGPDYVALGHIHGRATLSERARYSGAPLHYSFSEADKPRGGWLVDLDEGGLGEVSWLDFPVPRPLVVLTGELEHLLVDESYDRYLDHWVSGILTDQVRPVDGMRRLQSRFPYAAHLEYRPSIVADAGAASYQSRITARTDAQIVDGFLEFVRNGAGPSEAETAILAEVIAEQQAIEAGK